MAKTTTPSRRSRRPKSPDPDILAEDLEPQTQADDAPSSQTDEEVLLEEAKKLFERCVDAEQHNRDPAEEDIKFSRLSIQWPADIEAQRKADGRPCLTINDLPAFIRQVVNDSRMNKPAIKVGPQDSDADVETANIFSGLIRNIESTSDADVAYDTGVDQAVTSSFGYWRVSLDYSHDDSFDMDISIKRILNQFSVYSDPDSLSHDSADWNVAFVIDSLTHEQFEKQYKKSEKIDWDAAGYSSLNDTAWFSKDTVQVAEYWKREEITHTICLLSNGAIIRKDDLEHESDDIPGLTYQDVLAVEQVTIEDEREAKSWKVTQYILSGAEVLKTRSWPGRYIPIVPIYGDEVFSEGKRYLRSLTRDAQDPSRNFNYWRSASTELVALAPKVPWTGPEGTFSGDDQGKWQQTNLKNFPYITYKVMYDDNGQQLPGPQRQPLDVGPAAGALSEAANAADDKKRVMGLHNASLGMQSNETSGKAIMARQREGDVSTFHFSDNQGRAIRHTGRILIDLIPHVYNKRRIIRVLGEDGKHSMIPLNQPVPQTDQEGNPVPQINPQTGQPLVDQENNIIPSTRIYDLAKGKYDLVVKPGPSFTTRREEANAEMTELLRTVPQAATIILPRIAQNSDWPGAQDVADELKAMTPHPPDGPPPEVQQMMQQAQTFMQQMTKEKEQLQNQLNVLQANREVEHARIEIEGFRAETERAKAAHESQLDLQSLGLDAHVKIGGLFLDHHNAQQDRAQAAIAATPSMPEPAIPALRPPLNPGMDAGMPPPGLNGIPMAPPPPMPGTVAETQQRLDKISSQLDQLGKIMVAMLQQESAPVQVINDPTTNMPQSVKKGSIIRPVTYDNSGFPTGLGSPPNNSNSFTR